MSQDVEFLRGLDWASIRGGWRDLITDLARGDAPVVQRPVEAERRQPRINSIVKERVVLRLMTSVEIGEDEWRYSLDGDESMLTTIVGMRKITLNVRVETENESDDWFSFVTAERIRTRIWTPGNLERIASFNCAVIELAQTQNVSTAGDDRLISMAAFDIIFSASFEDQQPPDPTGWIEVVELTSHIQDVSGTDLPAALQLNQVDVPPGIS